MPPANFAYVPVEAGDAVTLPLALSVFADRAMVRTQMCEDAELAGFRIVAAEPVDSLLDDAIRPLGDVVLLDCPDMAGTRLAALARLDMRVANAGAQLIVSTSLDALDAVFGCLDQSAPQILIAPSRAERMIALGRALAYAPGLHVRELEEQDRLTLLRLTEQVAQLAQRLGGLEGAPATAGRAEGAFRFESPRPAFAAQGDDPGDRLVAPARPALPDARMIRQIIRNRQARARFFDGELFADPAWDILLDLTAARAEHARVSVTSLCIASGVPPTTALRWIGQMTDAGLLKRVEDPSDRRRAFIALTDSAADGMSRYFAQVGAGGLAVV